MTFLIKRFRQSAFIVLFIIAIFSFFNKFDISTLELEVKTISVSQSNLNLKVEWSTIWGGSGYEWGGYIVRDKLGNIYISGSTNSYGKGNRDIFLAKFSNTSVLLWNKTWGGSKRDDCYGITIDDSNNIYLTGGTYSFGSGNSDLILIKYNSDGYQLKNYTWGGIYEDYATSISLDQYGNILLGGMTNSLGLYENDMFLLMLNNTFNEVWNKTWGGVEFDMAFDLIIDASDNIYLGGRTDSFGSGSGDAVLVKYNHTGYQLWNRTWGGYNYEYCSGLGLDSVNNVYLTGMTSTYGMGQFDIILVKYNSLGGNIWEKVWGSEYLDEGKSVICDNEDNIYVVGETGSFGHPDGNLCFLKYNYEGMSEDVFIWGGSGKDIGWSSLFSQNIGFLVGGWSESFGEGLPNIFILNLRENPTKPDLIIYGYDNYILVILLFYGSFYLIKKRRKKIYIN